VRGGAEGWPGADGVWIASSRHSHTPGAGGSPRWVNAAGARGVSGGREPGGWPAADAGAAAGLALGGGSVAGR
jgi:hypothetical protein